MPIATEQAVVRSFRRWRIRGQVQGVGYRPFVYRLAVDLGLDGSVRNDPTGVTIEAWGSDGHLDDFQNRLCNEAPPLARVDSVEEEDCAADGSAIAPEYPSDPGFRIVTSDHSAAERGRVTIDSPVCPECLAEMRDPSGRRYRHGLINCTNCGPRYTIVRDLPYDRPNTTMASFAMCPACAQEYEDPGDRRFHAQPTCCPECGPRVRLMGADGEDVAGDPFAGAAALLLREDKGAIIAMKGLGGYHLVVDARNERAVRKLRRLKKRDHKPFAIMVGSTEEARRLVHLSDEAELMLASPVSPIVLAPHRLGEAQEDDAGVLLAPSVAPGSHRLGLMLPYTPMQQLLMDEVDGPLVMTSANLSDDPLVIEDGEARERLGSICDAYLAHDRPIERAVDDAIFADTSVGLIPLRRARGQVPGPLVLPMEADAPGLCVGADLKNSVAVVRGESAVVSQHIGDLTYTLAYERCERTIEDLLRLWEIEPRWIACDLHPRYLSRRIARRLARELGDVELIEVQHHHAHLASLMAEHERTDRMVGLICDGVGYGEGGTAWGGEILVGDLVSYQRVGYLRPLRLPGGDAAAKQTGRCAVSWLFDLFGEDAAIHSLTRRCLPDEKERSIILRMLSGDLNCPHSSGMGRLFDAAAALLGVCEYNHFEAMSGQMLEAAAERAAEHRPGERMIVLSHDEPFEMDHRPLLQELAWRLECGESVESLAWTFHDALASALAEAGLRAARQAMVNTVGLSGGVFCNSLLTGMVFNRLEQAGVEVLVHRQVPPNDGGISLGQAAVAAARRQQQQLCERELDE